MGGGRRLHNGTAQRGRRGGGAAGEQEGNGHLQEGAEEGVARGGWQGEVRHYLGCRVEEWRFPFVAGQCLTRKIKLNVGF